MRLCLTSLRRDLAKSGEVSPRRNRGNVSEIGQSRGFPDTSKKIPEESSRGLATKRLRQLPSEISIPRCRGFSTGDELGSRAARGIRQKEKRFSRELKLG